MPRYIFDVHDDGPVEWGDDGVECADRDEIERRVHTLIVAAQQRQVARGSLEALTTIYVHHESNGIVLVASVRPGEDVQFGWTPGSGGE
ncbi:MULTISPECIES: hypothetical protein [Methylobacterium]|uniref:hypothetical protein n=1 Tax=Methylobacterium TaxID=407 RepID=UPI0011C6FDEC|nr:MULTISPECIES: hypothetical protein [Methylobacterium]TXN20039.1 hypothetical protein FV217_19415 [Methylobacterium sp. WL9]